MSEQYIYGWQEFTGSYEDYETIDWNKHEEEVSEDSDKI